MILKMVAKNAVPFGLKVEVNLYSRTNQFCKLLTAYFLCIMCEVQFFPQFILTLEATKELCDMNRSYWTESFLG